MQRTARLAGFALLAACLAAPRPGHGLLYQGVNLPLSISAEGKTLKLQGAGLRKKFVFSVYVGALYLTVPTSDASAAVRADEPKRISLTFLRDVDGPKMREAFEEGFFKNSQGRLGALKSRIDAFLAIAAGDVKKGQELAFTYLPGEGVKVTLAGSPRGVVEGKDFMEAVWSIWLGEVPPGAELKKGMLGLAQP
ncbi:MAG: chalcone isomerase family protein [Deltaproteobacteria bacterium]|nr:chalcone isomerase family protein [Deltaproteobacteria bacterium]